jgi:hypothetical protein
VFWKLFQQPVKAVVGALFGLAYGIKMPHKKAHPDEDCAIMPLEGLWWSPDLATFSMDRRGDWEWTLQIAQPDLVTPAMLETARAALSKKKDNPAIGEVRLETVHEGRCAHILHLGPYADEAPTIARLHAFIKQQGLSLRGKHREIYLSDPARTAPEKMKTIIRQPVG